ncbi:MAG: hypothetical protein WA734_10395 [Candidatus Acidiferrales bacterium]
MRPASVIAIILLIVGIISLGYQVGYQGITYTTHKKVVDIGPIHATKQEHKTIPLPPCRPSSA